MSAHDNVFAARMAACAGQQGDLIPLLQAAQEAFGYVSTESMTAISERTGVPLSEVYGVVTFYKQLRLTPRGLYMIKMCNGTACHVNGSKMLETTFEDVLGILPGQTDKEGLFTLESVMCLGCCSLSPVVMVNEETHGNLTPRKLTSLLKRLQKEAREQAAQAKAG